MIEYETNIRFPESLATLVQILNFRDLLLAVGVILPGPLIIRWAIVGPGGTILNRAGWDAPVGLVETRVKLGVALALFSALLGLMSYASMAVISNEFRLPWLVAPLAGAAVGVASFVLLASAAKGFVDWLSNIIPPVAAGSGEPEEQEAEEELAQEDYTDEDLFLVYYLVDELAREMYRHVKSVRLEAFVDGAAYVYPELAGEEIDDEGEDYGDDELEEPEEPEAEFDSEGNLLVRLPESYFAELVSVVRRGEGEAAVVESEGELRSVYEVAKAIAMTGSDDEGLASYSAYKAVLHMIRSSRLVVPEKLKELLPFESRELRRRVREQVMEEGLI